MHSFHYSLCLSLTAITYFFLFVESFIGVQSLPLNDHPVNNIEEEKIDNTVNSPPSENKKSDENSLKSPDDAGPEINDNSKDVFNDIQKLSLNTSEETSTVSSTINLLSNLTSVSTESISNSTISSWSVIITTSEKLDTINHPKKDNSLVTASETHTNGNDVVLEGTTPIHHHKEPTFTSVMFDWLKDSYTLSILIPVASGAGAALGFMAAITLIIYLRRRCYCCKRKTRRLPDSIRKMRLDDRKILLEGTSDEEF